MDGLYDIEIMSDEELEEVEPNVEEHVLDDYIYNEYDDDDDVDVDMVNPLYMNFELDDTYEEMDEE